MNQTTKTALAGALFLCLGAGVLTAWKGQDSGSHIPAPSQSTEPALRVVHAQPIVSLEPFVHYYRAETPSVSGGYLLVLEVDPTTARARQAAEPVMFGGAETLERFNSGDPDGYRVVFLPTTVDSQGEPWLDLADTPFYFGLATLPEQVDADVCGSELERAFEEGCRAPSQAEWQAARDAGGETLVLSDRQRLEEAAARLILEWAPGERHIADGILID